MNPTVSVVLPPHNRPGLLMEAIQSLAAQRFQDFEVIFVDDHSTPPVDAEQFPPTGHHPIVLSRNPRPIGGPPANPRELASRA